MSDQKSCWNCENNALCRVYDYHSGGGNAHIKVTSNNSISSYNIELTQLLAKHCDYYLKNTDEK